jgi:hypothetical protein
MTTKYAEKFLTTDNSLSGVKFIIQSKKLNEILIPFKLKKKIKTKPGGFGDSYWYMLLHKQTIRVPNNHKELAEWILGFFEIYGSIIMYDDENDTNYEVLGEKTRKQMVSAIAKHMDEILEDLKIVNISTISVDKSGYWTGCQVSFTASAMEHKKLSKTAATGFLNAFNVEIDYLKMSEE